MRSEVTRRELLAGAGTAAVATALPQGALAQQSGDDWPAFGYDLAKTGFNPDGEGPGADAGGAWRFDQPADGITVGAAVVDGVVYAASRDGNLYAVDAETGDEVEGWPVELDAELRSPPTVADETVYVGDRDGTAYAVDTATGETRWRFGTNGAVEGSPTVTNGTVFLTSRDGSVYAVDADTGERTAWEFDTGSAITGGVAVDHSTGGETGRVYVGNTRGVVFALDIADGELQWEEAYEASGEISSAPVFDDGRVYVGTTAGTAGYVEAIDAEVGEREWWTETDGPVFGSPAVGDGAVYVVNRGQHVSAMDAASGELDWDYGTGRQLNNSPVVVGNTVYAVNFDGDVFGLSAGGEEQFTIETETAVSASPAVAGGRLYVGTEEGSLLALETGGTVDFTADIDPNGDDPADDGSSPLEESDPHDLAFLVLPASAVAFFGLLAGGLYALFRSDWASKFAVDEAPIESMYDDEDEIPDYDDRSETDAWSLVVADVVRRAAEQTKTAEENVIVTKHVDDTLESPIVAYEIESARDGRARITLTEELSPSAADSLREQPLNEGWRLDDGELAFETTVAPGEQVRTMIGRTDRTDEPLDSLLDKPVFSVEALDTRADGE